MPRPIVLSATLAALFTLSPALGFSANDARWYRVELLVFSQPAAQVAESWPPTPELSYPAELQFLVQRDQLPLAPPVVDVALPLQGGLDGSSEPGDIDRASLDVDPNNPNAAETLPEGKSPEDTAGTLNDTTLDEVSVDDTQLPTSFALLPRDAMEFRGKGAYMERQGGYKVLFHENWAQLIGPKSESPHIVIPSRTSLAGWPELQGSIQLHLARYLHIETNLWLNTHNQKLPRGWKMPAPPQAPQTPYKTPEERAELEETAAMLVEGESDMQGYRGFDSGDESLADVEAQDAATLSTEAVETELSLNQVYPFRHAVLMQQKRRMRSIEVHYLDHPLFGIVVKLSPLDEDELAILAAAEPRAQESTQNTQIGGTASASRPY